MGAMARWLASFEQPVPLIGYSLGGRMALLAALDHPDLVERLILISASPGIAGDTARAERRTRDEALADHIEAVGTKAFLDEWLDGPIAGTGHLDDEVRRRDRAIREVNTAPAWQRRCGASARVHSHMSVTASASWRCRCSPCQAAQTPPTPDSPARWRTQPRMGPTYRSTERVTT